MRRKQGNIILLLILSVTLLILARCSKDHQPVAYNNPLDDGQVSTPPIPRNLATQIGDNTVTLMWEISNPENVRWYRIARKDSSGGEFALIDSVAQEIYTDHGLKNGRTYWYRICVITPGGFEGTYSAQISARPGSFSISINGGDKYTTSTSVTLSISAPNGASLIMLANDYQFTGASWEPFVLQKNWHLNSGDGEKEVYLKIRDADDNEASDIQQDDIILDTRASIDALSFSPYDSVLTPGDMIHFTMQTGEVMGQASVDIGTAAFGKKLYDDGTHGDQTAQDGNYERSFTIPSGLEVIDAPVKGRFTDEAGNSADEMTAVHPVTIQRPPEPVQLSSPTSLGSSEIAFNLTWSQNQDADFVAYRLYRSQSPGVDTAVDRKLVVEIGTQATTSFDDTDLEENQTYYYMIYVYDKYGLSTGSNEVSGTTDVNQAPEAVTLLITNVLLTPGDSSSAEIELKWTRNQDADFDHYIVYRDVQSPVSTSSIPIDLINHSATTTTTDMRLDLSTTYYYRVFICDEGNLCTGSNEVNATTPSGL